MTVPKIEISVTDKFKPLYNLPSDVNTIICIGGRGGMKTYEVSKWVAVSATIQKKRAVIVRDEKALIKETILNEIWARYDTANEYGDLDKFYVKNETELKDKLTGKTLIYTKGFRASNSQKRANLKGASDIDLAIVEEGEDIVSQDLFNTFVDSLRKEGCIVTILLNTPDIGHFLLKRYFNTSQITGAEVPELVGKGVKESELDGYFKIVPKQLPGFLCIQTGFEDNPFLPKHITDSYRSYGDPDSEKYNLHYYLTAIKGFASSGRKGQVLKKVKPIKLADYMALPFKEYYGQDFGTASPAALVGVKFEKNNCYCRLINYKPMSTMELGKLYCTLNFHPKNDKIIADSADAKAIQKLRHGFKREDLSEADIQKYPQLLKGFFVVPCVKGTDSITAGISLMDGMNLFAVEEHQELWEEINNYIYDQDKNGNYTNDPKDEYNHAIDGWRYIVNDQRGKVAFQMNTG